MLQHLIGLKYEDTPDYDLIEDSFRNCIEDVSNNQHPFFMIVV